MRFFRFFARLTERVPSTTGVSLGRVIPAAVLLVGVFALPVMAGIEIPRWSLPATRIQPRPCMAGMSGAGRVRGLLVGIDEYEKYPSLSGSVNDVRFIAKTLIDSTGAAPADLTLLVNSEATTERVEGALDALVAATSCGDVVVIHFSGTGATVQGRGWAVFLHDMQKDRSRVLENGFLPASDVLPRVVTAIRNRGAFAFVVIDACDSAQARVSSEISGEISAGNFWRWAPGSDDAPDPSRVLIPEAGGYAAILMEGIEYEVPTHQSHYGLLSFSMATALMASPGASIRDLARATWERALAENKTGSRFRPVFQASDSDATPFLRGTVRSAPDASRKIELLKPVPTRGVLVNEGRRVHVEGRVTPAGQATIVVVANTTTLPKPDGTFTVDVDLEPGKQPLFMVAVLRDHSSISASFDVEVTAGLLEPGSGKRYALVIGNAAYTNGWAPLETPVRDAEAVAKLLKEQYGFALELPPRGPDDTPYPLLLKNATKAQMQHALFELERRTGTDDSILVYYAGHGHSDPAISYSYWIPVDADQEFPGQWLSADEVNGFFGKMVAKHVLVVSDSCFSGNMATRDSTPVKPVDPKYREERRRYLANSMLRSSRSLLSSGGNEPVLDGGGQGHSIFANAFLRGLQEFEDDTFSVGELFQRIKPSVAGNSKQAPQFQFLGRSGNEGGELVFFRVPKK
jgi:hypothetical protein